MTQVGICDDDPEARAFLEVVVARESTFSVEAVCSSGEEALSIPSTIDVWLMDLRMPGMGGRRACEMLLENDPKVRVLFLTSFPEESVVESLRSGASGYLFKDEKPHNIIAAVKAVAAGLGIGSWAAVETLVERKPTANVSELAVDGLDEDLVGLVLAGYSNHEMAKTLHLSESGIKKRLNRLMLRAGVGSRPMLMAKLYGWSASD